VPRIEKASKSGRKKPDKGSLPRIEGPAANYYARVADLYGEREEFQGKFIRDIAIWGRNVIILAEIIWCRTVAPLQWADASRPHIKKHIA
jgi:hypothetical protein